MIYLIHDIGDFLIRAIDIYRLILIVYFLMSWLPGAYQSRLGEILYKICEPYVGFFRQFVPSIGFISLSGIVSLFALSLIKSGVIMVINILIRLLY